MKNADMIKKVGLLEKRLQLAEKRIEQLSRSRNDISPMVINSMLQTNRPSSILDGFFT